MFPFDPRHVPTEDQLKDAKSKLSKADLRSIPFGTRLKVAIDKDFGNRSRFRNFAWHNQAVFGYVDRLKDLRMALGGAERTLDPGRDEPTWRRLRLTAFLHDIGKALDPSRHPILGWHILIDLASVGPSDREAAQAIRQGLETAKGTNGAEEYRRFALLVRDHDKFGNITTGEASYVVLARLVSLGSQTGRSLQQLRDTWLLNLADMAGTYDARLPHRSPARARTPAQADAKRPDVAKALDVRLDNFDALIADWKTIVAVLSQASYAAVTRGLREASETPEFTLQRIRRLLIARAGSWPRLLDALTLEVVEEALETHVSCNDLLPFCRDFAMVAKLDYALQFWNELADYLYFRNALTGSSAKAQKAQDVEDILATSNNEKNLPQGESLAMAWGDFQRQEYCGWLGLLVGLSRNTEGKKVWDKVRDILEEIDPEVVKHIARNQAGLLIAILRRVVMAYRGLIRGGGSDGTAIGVGFSYLRSDDPEKRYALYELLSGGGDARERGLRWLIDEIASWEMLA